MPPITDTAPSRPVTQAVAQTRLDSLTGLRWYAALLIFCYHFAHESKYTTSAHRSEILNKITLGGPSAVSLFFILSGFVLVWSARIGDKPGSFWRRRFARIYPSHAVTFLVAALLLVWEGKPLVSSIALGNLTLTQSWIPNRADWWFGFNGVSWSLSCEFFFYFSFPFLVPLLRRLSARGLWATLIAGNLAVILVPFLADFVEGATGWNSKYFIYMLPPVRLVEFAIGIVLALLVKGGHWRGPGTVISFILSGAAVFVLSLDVPYIFHWNACTVIPYTFLIAALARNDIRGKRSLLRHPVLVYLGEVSFAFYLTHEMVIFGLNYFLAPRPLSPLAQGTLVMAISLAGAIVLHTYVEKPCVKLLTPRRRARPQPA
ncbi:acyltransferase [Streptomyces sp. NPDC050617]|uniref:acyltransferase family protein n=1 Tax=Streptomyces sp. NPDC050617 TaxID=3154628 RepID=UPI00341E8246